MTLYVPDRLPFWEIRDGEGPITKRLAGIHKISHRRWCLDRLYRIQRDQDELSERLKVKAWWIQPKHREQIFNTLNKLQCEKVKIEKMLGEFGSRHDRDVSPDPDRGQIVRLGGGDGNGNRWVGHGKTQQWAWSK